MASIRTRKLVSRGPRVITLAVLTGAGAWAPSARAHFRLDAPAAATSQDASGSPQKLGPCGDEAGGKATGIVTQFQPGETITVQWTEIVAHDGWYRIALSYRGGADLIDPPVVIASNGASADAGVEAPPIAPVLADGLFRHLSAGAAGKQYTYSLKLPSVPCAQCTLQVIQYMNGHGSNLPNFPDGGINPDGYFYHHCANISIAGADAGIGNDGGRNGGSGDAAGADVTEGADASGASLDGAGSSNDGVDTSTSNGADDGSVAGPSSGSASPGQGGGSSAIASGTSGSTRNQGGGSAGASGAASASTRSSAGPAGAPGASSGTDAGGCLVSGVGSPAAPGWPLLLGVLTGVGARRRRGSAARRRAAGRR